MEFRKIVWPGRFTLNVPENWMCSEGDGVVSCYDAENGVGVMQVSLFAKTPSSVTGTQVQDVTLRFAANRNWNLSVHDVSKREVAGSVISEFEYREDAEQTNYWRVVHVLASTRMALLTYTCGFDDRGVEREIVGHVLSTFEWEGPFS